MDRKCGELLLRREEALQQVRRGAEELGGDGARWRRHPRETWSDDGARGAGWRSLAAAGAGRSAASTGARGDDGGGAKELGGGAHQRKKMAARLSMWRVATEAEEADGRPRDGVGRSTRRIHVFFRKGSTFYNVRSHPGRKQKLVDAINFSPFQHPQGPIPFGFLQSRTHGRTEQGDSSTRSFCQPSSARLSVSSLPPPRHFPIFPARKPL